MSPNNEAEKNVADSIYDICYAVNLLSRFSSNPDKAHCEAVKRVMRYLKRATEQDLIYKKNLEDIIAGYFDGDWAGNLDDRHSTTGYIFIIQSAEISWMTKKQKTFALSSTEAEFMQSQRQYKNRCG